MERTASVIACFQVCFLCIWSPQLSKTAVRALGGPDQVMGSEIRFHLHIFLSLKTLILCAKLYTTSALKAPHQCKQFQAMLVPEALAHLLVKFPSGPAT